VADNIFVGRLLVVDDEPLMAAMVARILQAEHQVTVAHSAVAAWQWLEAGEAFDFMICDLSLPGMDGLELYGRVQRALPRLAARTLFITGGARSPEARRFVEAHPERCLGKPFEAQALRDRLSALDLKE
jgi:CheY-like chemotaxis protein